jgi:predicted Zn-dependent protease
MTARQYEAHAFHDDMPSGRAAGTLSITPSAARFSGGGKTVDLPLDGLSLKLGGAGDRVIFLSHEDQPDWTIYTSDLSLREDSALLSRPHLAAMIAAMNRKRFSAVAWLVAIGLVFLLIPVGLFALRKPAAGFLAAKVPPAWEEKLGQSVIDSYAPETMVGDASLNADLGKLTSLLTEAVASRRYTFRFYIVEDETLNAFATPGGFVVLHSGLILKADSAEEVLGVLGHEIAHVTRQHSLKHIISSAGTFLLIQALLGDASGLLAVVADAGPYLLSQQFSRDNERDADQTGFDYLVRAGVDPAGMVRFFEKLQRESGERDAVEGTLNFLSTHPTTAERIERLRTRLTEVDRALVTAVDFDFETFQSKLREVLDRRNQNQ